MVELRASVISFSLQCSNHTRLLRETDDDSKEGGGMCRRGKVLIWKKKKTKV